MLNIISLPAQYKYFTLEAAEKIKSADIVVVQTEKTPAFAEIERNAKRVVTLDAIFEQAESFDELYAHGAQYIEEISNGEEAVFLILGQPSQNGFVRILKDTVALNYIYGGSGADLAAFLCSAGSDYNGAYVTIDARELNNLQINTSQALIITGIENKWISDDVKLHLQEYYCDETPVIFICGEVAENIILKNLSDREEYGAGATVAIGAQPLINKKSYSFIDLLNIMKILRGAGGCPWDAKQTHKSLKPYLIEESYEVADAVDSGDIYALYDELGDVLLQVVFHAVIAAQFSEFTIDDVTTAICSKLINRHPHVFGKVSVKDADEVLVNWEEIKRAEKSIESVADSLKDVPQSLGALMRAAKIQKKAACVGFDWQTASQALEKVVEETAELAHELNSDDFDKIETEGGDLLFAVVNVLRKCGVNPELALKATCEKFIKRFTFIEKNSDKDLKVMTLEEMDALWNLAKDES